LNAGFGRESQSGVYERILGIAKTLATIVLWSSVVSLAPTASEVFVYLLLLVLLGKLKEDAPQLRAELGPPESSIAPLTC